jgi:thioredoxin 1
VTDTYTQKTTNILSLVLLQVHRLIQRHYQFIVLLYTMPLCCIGGICIPYTAILPLLIYGAQWLLQKMADAGLLPESISKQLQGLITIKPNSNSSSDCCKVSAETSMSLSSSSNVRRRKQSKETGTITTQSCDNKECAAISETVEIIEAENDWEKLMSSEEKEEELIICKFTATWCKPCKEIQPLFESFSKTHRQTKFVVVDVDVLDDLASSYKVITLPTFVAIKRGRVVEKYSGSNPEQLQNFISSAINIASTVK